jgi:serine/threonine protein kinase
MGLVHRDLKPGNIFLTRSGGEEIVKVLDFGIVKQLKMQTESTGVTRSGVILGSPPYMSPEQVFDPKQVDPRSDLWSLGVILYELLTGRRPFEPREGRSVLVAICTDGCPPPSTVVPELGAQVDSFFVRALDRDPAARFQSVGELLEAFAALTHPAAALRRVPVGDIQVDPYASTLPQPERASRRADREGVAAREERATARIQQGFSLAELEVFVRRRFGEIPGGLSGIVSPVHDFRYQVFQVVDYFKRRRELARLEAELDKALGPEEGEEEG